MKPMEVDEFQTVDMDFQHPSDLGDLHLQNENTYRLMPVEPQTPPVEYIYIDRTSFCVQNQCQFMDGQGEDE